MNEIERVETGFAQVKNEVLFDPKISLKAKGLFAYIYAKPSRWDFSGNRIAKEMKEGRKAIYSALNELEQEGYLLRQKQADGRVKYLVSFTKKPDAQNGHLAQKPDAQNGKEPKRQRAKSGSISNKELNKQRELINKECTPAQIAKEFFSDEADHSELIDFFVSKGISEEAVRQEIQKFKMYWTEPNKSGTKTRWQMQKTFEIRRRLFTWFNRANQSYSTSQKETKGITI